MFRPSRARYRIVEPLITFYEAVMRKRWAEREIHRLSDEFVAARAEAEESISLQPVLLL